MRRKGKKSGEHRRDKFNLPKFRCGTTGGGNVREKKGHETEKMVKQNCNPRGGKSEDTPETPLNRIKEKEEHGANLSL